MWAGLVVTAVCAAVFVVAARGSDDRVSVLAVARPVQAGQLISRADLSEVDLRGAGIPGVVPASEAGQVVGRVAVVPLMPGALLSPAQVGDGGQFPPAGRSLVAVLVKDGAAPSGLAAGQRVAVVAGPTQGSGRADAASGPSAGTAGLVVSVKDTGPSSGGGLVVTVLVDASAAAGVAVLADPRLVVLASVEGVPR